MWCFKGEELDLLQRHEITTAEKSFTRHINFTQGSHVIEVEDAFRDNTVHVEPFMSRYMSIHQTTWRLFVCYSEKFYRLIRFLTNFLHGSKFINKPTRTLSSFNKQRIRSRTPCVFLFLNHKNMFFSKRRGIYRYHFSMRDSFHDRDERILLWHIQDILL